MKAANTLSFHCCTALNGCVLRVALIRFAVLQSVWPISQPLATCKTLPSKMLSATLRRTARVALSHRSGSSARSNTLTLVAVNDVYDLEHLPKLRTLVDAVTLVLRCKQYLLNNELNNEGVAHCKSSLFKHE